MHSKERGCRLYLVRVREGRPSGKFLPIEKNRTITSFRDKAWTEESFVVAFCYRTAVSKTVFYPVQFHSLEVSMHDARKLGARITNVLRESQTRIPLGICLSLAPNPSREPLNAHQTRAKMHTIFSLRAKRRFEELCYLQLAVVSCPANINVMTSDVISSSDKLFPFSS